ncbi:type VI secretion system baseplate subunit TssF [Aureimonas sp. ME7]|uniref:type VI secretion system baseplate subunit TssF n=1 Tax=Aureimonas sp. ME7 TaxID=2744252 RepID=UPI0015F629F2|nr:type VI secretion system baseplate subunit TssF [Aureimonas sp. ME7]
MAEGFLQRYADELGNLRRRAARFASAHPKIAGRLRISGEQIDDPHVERMVQSFAFASARVRQKLDDEFPELTGSMLETLYPHYLAPVPSMMMVRLSPVAGLETVQHIARHTEIVAEPIEDERCRFRLSQGVDLAPLRVERAALGGQPIEAPLAPQWSAAACLSLRLSPLAPVPSIAALGIDRLRFYLDAPFREATALHELLANHALGVALARHAGDRDPVFLPASSIRAGGFEPDEGMLPYPASSFAGYRLLSEFFALPQKFLFLELSGLRRWTGETLEIFIYLDRSEPVLERAVSAETFALNAAPAVNLFRQRAEPIVVDGRRSEYALVPDARRHLTREVYGVESVTLTDRAGNRTVAPRFFEGGSADVPAWQVRRQFDPLDGTSDVAIAFAGGGETGDELVAGIDTLCLNRDLPKRLPFGGGHPHLDLADPSASVGRVEALGAPTPALRFDGNEDRRWRLLSHLNLNHLSLADGDGTAMKEMLRLYVRPERREANLLIDAICGVSSRPAMSRIGGGGMVPGTEVTLTFEPGLIDRGAAYLFASVIDRFLGLYATINSFTRMTAVMRGQSEPVAAFPARLSERPLL